jgi:hypothetical protein
MVTFIFQENILQTQISWTFISKWWKKNADCSGTLFLNLRKTRKTLSKGNKILLENWISWEWTYTFHVQLGEKVASSHPVPDSFSV